MPNLRDVLQAAAAAEHAALDAADVLRAFTSVDTAPAIDGDDLATLGVRALSCEIVWDAPCSAAQALGAVDALDGDMPGVRDSGRALPAAHPSQAPAGRFVQDHGEHTRQDRTDQATCLGDLDSVRWPDVVGGSRAAVRAVASHFSERVHVEING